MNLNNFFVDKLSNGHLIDQQNRVSKTGSNLFSDIINVCDDENLQIDAAIENFGQSNVKELFSPSENVIYTSAAELDVLSDYISNFLKKNPQILVSESSSNLQSVEVNKKILDFNKTECETFINGLLSNILSSNKQIEELSAQELNTLKSNLQKDLFSNEEGIKRLLDGLMSNLSSGNAFEPDKELLKISTDELEHTYNSTNSESLTTTLVNYLEKNSILNLTFKNQLNKVSLNFAATAPNISTAKLELLETSSQNSANTTAITENLLNNQKNLELSDIKAEVIEITDTNSKENKISISQIHGREAQLISKFNLSSEAEKLFTSSVLNTKNANLNIAEVTSFSVEENLPDYKSAGIDNGAKNILNAQLPKNNIEGESGRNITAQSSNKNSVNATNSTILTNLKETVASTNSVKPVDYKFQNLEDSINKKVETQNSTSKDIKITAKEVFRELNLEKVEISFENNKILKSAEQKSASEIKAINDLKADTIRVDESLKVNIKKNDEIVVNKTAITGTENKAKTVIQNDSQIFEEVEKLVVKTKSKITSENIKFENSESIKGNAKILDEKNGANENSVQTNKKISGEEVNNYSAKDQKGHTTANKDLVGSVLKGNTEINPKKEIINVPVDLKMVKKDENSESAKLSGAEKESLNTKMELSGAENTSGHESSSSFGGDKEMAKHTVNELNKNSALSATSFINDLEGERLKVFSELKHMHESFKVIKPAEIFNEFSKMITGTEKQSLTFQLNPENLGKIKLMVDFTDNQLVTRIEVENDQVKHFIQSNIETLKQQLSSSGIHLSNVSISLADYDQKNNKQFVPKKKNSGRMINENSDEDLLKSDKRILGYNTLEYLV